MSCHFKGKFSRPTITHVLRKCGFTKYVKMNQKSTLTDKHKRIRRETVLIGIRDNVDWKNVIFSDKKRLNIDVPDGFNCYFYDLRKAKGHQMDWAF